MNVKTNVTHECDNLMSYWAARYFMACPSRIADRDVSQLTRMLPFLSRILPADDRDELDIFMDPGLGKGGTPGVLRRVLRALKRNLGALGKKAWDVDPRFLSNLEGICDRFGLEEPDRRLLAFVLVSENFEPFKELISLDEMSLFEMTRVLAAMLGISRSHARKFLAGSSRLSELGLVRLERSGFLAGPDLELLPGLETYCFLSDGDDVDLFGSMCSKMPPSTLSREDFAHVRELDLVRRFLEGSLSGKKRGSNVLVYGPPGTGKTELARRRAEMLDLELVSRSASDLLNCYVGETEQAIAEMFRQASGRRYILFLDEADSMFQSRGRAVHSWEVTMVNEMLARMERFDRIFICATNLADTMDQAAARRFDFRVEFRHMLPVQAWEFFRLIFGDEVTEEHRARLDLLRLTPGNFGTVYRRLKLYEALRPFSPDLFIRELEAEAQTAEEVEA